MSGLECNSHATRSIRGRVTASGLLLVTSSSRPLPPPARELAWCSVPGHTLSCGPQNILFLQAMDVNSPQVPSTPSSSRKRSRENETPSQRHKREKAAERQRRKRERDRQAGLQNILALSQQQAQQVPPPPVEVQPPPPIQPPQQPQPIVPEYKGEELSVEEVAKRDRIRAAARERQRKHRALVKARKLRELGLDMGNDIMPALDEYGRMNPEGQYPPVMPHEMPPHPHPQAHPMHEPPFPQGQPLGGQTFASTLLLSFSCAPLLKQHLLRTLSMTNEELASLEPIIAQAWDHWDQQVRTLILVHVSSFS